MFYYRTGWKPEKVIERIKRGKEVLKRELSAARSKESKFREKQGLWITGLRNMTKRGRLCWLLMLPGKYLTLPVHLKNGRRN